MNSTFVMTVTGPSSLGIIKALAHTTHEFGGNWVRSKVIKQDCQFAAIIKTTIAENKETELKAALVNEFSPLHFTFAELPKEQEEATRKVTFKVDCKDRAGLVKDLNNLLLNMELDVTHMEAHRYEVAEIGRTVFSATLEVNAPECTSNEMIEQELESLEEGVRVSVL
ncbi:MAG: ACT domain-containing protein [Verrucomicrobiota bacterium]